MAVDQVTPNTPALSQLQTELADDLKTEVVDQTVFASLEDAQEDGEPDLIIELIDLYLGDTPQWVKAIRVGVAQADAAAIKRAAHTLKGSSSTVGVCQVAEICKLLEQLNGQDIAGKGDTLVYLLEREFERARTALLNERDRRCVREF